MSAIDGWPKRIEMPVDKNFPLAGHFFFLWISDLLNRGRTTIYRFEMLQKVA